MVEPTPFGSRLTIRQRLLQARLIEGPDFVELIEPTPFGSRLTICQRLILERV
jgi:hypothetical protein